MQLVRSCVCCGLDKCKQIVASKSRAAVKRLLSNEFLNNSHKQNHNCLQLLQINKTFSKSTHMWTIRVTVRQTCKHIFSTSRLPKRTQGVVRIWKNKFSSCFSIFALQFHKTLTISSEDWCHLSPLTNCPPEHLFRAGVMISVGLKAFRPSWWGKTKDLKLLISRTKYRQSRATHSSRIEKSTKVLSSLVRLSCVQEKKE